MFESTLAYRNSLKANAELYRLESIDISFVLIERELLEVSMFSV